MIYQSQKRRENKYKGNQSAADDFKEAEHLKIIS
jgi:hypothetical protein